MAQELGMKQERAIVQLRSQIKQLAAAAASQCLADRAGSRAPLLAFDELARQLAAPAFEALTVIVGEPQTWPKECSHEG